MPDCSRIDSLVTPYVDGELAASDAQVVERHIGLCPPCRAKVATERAVRALMQMRRTDLCSGHAPSSLKGRCSAMRQRLDAPVQPPAIAGSAVRTTPRWRTRLAPLALAASLVLLVGGAFLYQATRSSATLMAAELTADHVKCFRLNSVLGTRDSHQAVEAAMARGFAWDMHLPPADTAQLELVGSRPCLYAEGRVAHIMYRHNGEPVSLFMLPREARREQLVEVFGHQCRIWSEGDRTFVLVARNTAGEMEQVAALVRAAVR
jgi:anti-sigma factor RsiW